MKRTNFQFIYDELRLELRPAIPFLVSREPLRMPSHVHGIGTTERISY